MYVPILFYNDSAGRESQGAARHGTGLVEK
jgi:hypothetical protein